MQVDIPRYNYLHENTIDLHNPSQIHRILQIYTKNLLLLFIVVIIVVVVGGGVVVLILFYILIIEYK